MADNYTTAGSAQTVRVLSQTQVIDVEAVAIWTKPSSVYMVVQVPLAAWQAGNQDQYLAPPAELVEQLIQGGLVVGVTQVQAVDSSQLLSSFLDLTVSYTPTTGITAPFTAIVRAPFTAFETLDAFQAWESSVPPDGPVVNAWKQLRATANA